MFQRTSVAGQLLQCSPCERVLRSEFVMRSAPLTRFGYMIQIHIETKVVHVADADNFEIIYDI